jgi:hypothetical protein
MEDGFCGAARALPGKLERYKTSYPLLDHPRKKIPTLIAPHMTYPQRAESESCMNSLKKTWCIVLNLATIVKQI